MSAKLSLLICAALLYGSMPALRAGEPPPPPPPPPEKPWFPFPELPTVLWFEDFENGAGALTLGKLDDAPANVVGAAGAAAGGAANPGGVPAKAGGPAGNAGGAPANPAGAAGGTGVGSGKAYLLSEVSFTNTERKGAWAKIELSRTKVKIPGGNKPAAIQFHFLIWAEEAGNLQITLPGKEKSMTLENVAAAKKWLPISFTLGAFIHIKPTDNPVSDVELLFIPRMSKTYQKVYIDDILITNGVAKLATLMPAVQMAQKRIKEIERTVAKDGFGFSPQNQETLKALLTSSHRRRAKSVLVVGPRPADGAALAKALNAAATKAKLAGYTFTAAEAPDKSAAGGLDDMRALLKCMIEKNSPQFVLLAPSYRDIKGGGVPADSLRIVIERTMAAGCVPLVVLPPVVAAVSQGDKPRIEGFANAVNNTFGARGIPLMDPSVALKAAAAPLTDGELNEAGLEGVATVAVAALKHLDTYVISRK
ncbi:MAG: hypothetical protein NTW87_16285 [Planctomycetota bacterium]|nr:hypothetical protein [Planctomycetota bacterium]